MFYGKEVMSTPPIPSSSQSPTDFSQALEIFKTNYVQYRASGRPEYKIAYENANAYITSYLQSMQTEIENDRKYVNRFVAEYSNANPELTQLQSQFRTIRKEGPAVQDKYATIRRVNNEVPEINYTEYYVKAGLIVGFVGMIALFAR